MSQHRNNTTEQIMLKIILILCSLLISASINFIDVSFSIKIILFIVSFIISYLINYFLILKNIIGYFIPKYLAHRLFGCHVGFWKYLKGHFNEVEHGMWNEKKHGWYDAESVPEDQRDHILMYTHQCKICGRLWDETHGGAIS